MNPCDDCPIDDKLFECCGRHPETGAVARLALKDGRVVYACPHLSADGSCLIYDKRPYGCRMHQCDRFARKSVSGEGLEMYAALWGDE